MKAANDIGDTKIVYNVVKTLSDKTDKKPPVDLNINSKTGKLIVDATERAEVWYGFLKKKFAATAKETNERPAMETLPTRDPVCSGGENSVLDTRKIL